MKLRDERYFVCRWDWDGLWKCLQREAGQDFLSLSLSLSFVTICVLRFSKHFFMCISLTHIGVLSVEFCFERAPGLHTVRSYVFGVFFSSFLGTVSGCRSDVQYWTSADLDLRTCTGCSGLIPTLLCLICPLRWMSVFIKSRAVLKKRHASVITTFYFIAYSAFSVILVETVNQRVAGHSTIWEKMCPVCIGCMRCLVEHDLTQPLWM